MKLLEKKTENCQALLTIEMESAEVEQSLEKSYGRLVKKTEIPGFRKGKAPREVLERHVGKASLLEDALDYLLPRACADAIEEHKIKAIANPTIKVTKTEPVVFEAVVPLPPVVKLADYHRFKMKPEPAKFKKGDVDNVISKLRQQGATWEPVDRPVKMGDIVVIDVTGSVEDKPFLAEQGAHLRVVGGSSLPAPGFSEQIVGMKTDEAKEFRLSLPENYPDSGLVGKEAVFKVKVLEVREEKLAQLNDDFAKTVAPGIKTVKALRRLIVLVDVEVDRMLGQHLERLRAGASSPEEYTELVKKTSREELAKQYRPLAERRVKSSLVLDEVVKAEKIEVKNSDIDAEIARITQNAGDKKEEQQKILNNPQNRESIGRMLTTREAVKRLVTTARGSVKKPRVKKEAK
jgi:trigger factor